MTIKKIGKITLAMTLIGVGFLLLAEKFLTIPFRDFFKYWPILIIALGTEMIISVIIYWRKKDVILKYNKTALLTAVIFSLVASSVTNTFGFTGLAPQAIFDGMKYKNQKTETFTKDNISANTKVTQIVVDSSFGNIYIKPSSGKNIKAEVAATLHFNEKTAVSGGLENLLTITEGNITTIKTDADKSFPGITFARTKLNLTVYVPSEISIQASNSFGEIRANDLKGEIVLINKHGKLIAQNINGTLIVDNSFGSIDVSDISGNIKIINRNGSIVCKSNTLKNSNITLKTSYGKIHPVLGVAPKKGNNVSTFNEILGTGIYNINIENSYGSIILE